MTRRSQLSSRLLGIWLGSVLCGVTIISGCAELPPPAIPVAPQIKPEIVVFDVDGTLTPTAAQIFTARKDAAKVVQMYARNGYRIVYLTARIGLFQGAVPVLLKENDFPHGDIVVAKTDDEQDHPDKFKARILKEYRARGWEIVAAYGDSESDFLAYSIAEIPKERVFALRRKGEAHCEPGVWMRCISEWTELLDKIPQYGLTPFFTDGCSWFPDRSPNTNQDWCHCCVVHDLAYWRGGTAQERLAADKELRTCVVRETNDRVLADLMYTGVRAGGGPGLATSYRWGYGWPFGRGYKALSPSEQALASELEAKYRATNPTLACPSK